MTQRYMVIVLTIAISLFTLSCSSPDDDTTAPSIPSNFDYSGSLSGDGGVYLTWSENSEDDLAGYRVYRSFDNADFSYLATTQDDFYLDSGLDYNTAYSYKITAIDDEDNESGFTSEVTVIPINLNPPATPTNFEIKAHNLPTEYQVNVELTWTHNTEADFSHYKLYRSSLSDLFATNDESFLDSTTENNYIDEDVTPGTTYHYKLIAYDYGYVLEAPAAGPVSDTPLEEPSLIAPIDGNTVAGLNPTFFWNNVDQAVKYKIIVRTSSQTGDIWEETVDANDELQMSITYPGSATALEANTLYYWFISGYSQDSDEINVFTAVTGFRTP